MVMNWRLPTPSSRTVIPDSAAEPWAATFMRATTSKSVSPSFAKSQPSIARATPVVWWSTLPPVTPMASSTVHASCEPPVTDQSAGRTPVAYSEKSVNLTVIIVSALLSCLPCGTHEPTRFGRGRETADFLLEVAERLLLFGVQ